MGAYTVVRRGRWLVIPEGKNDAETLAALVDAFSRLGASITPFVLNDAECALYGARNRGRIVIEAGFAVRYDKEPFNPIIEVREC